MTIVIGIDPGLVDTGVVILDFDFGTCVVLSTVITGKMSHAIQLADELGPMRLGKTHMFIESYRPRGNIYSTDERMRKLLADFRHHFPRATIVDNMDVKKIIRRELMDILGVWNFQTSTHHQDLRSAARIALLGMVKDPKLNQILYDHVEERITP